MRSRIKMNLHLLVGAERLKYHVVHDFVQTNHDSSNEGHLFVWKRRQVQKRVVVLAAPDGVRIGVGSGGRRRGGAIGEARLALSGNRTNGEKSSANDRQ